MMAYGSRRCGAGDWAFESFFLFFCRPVGSSAFAPAFALDLGDDPVFTVDVWHGSGNITPDDVACWRANGVEHVIPGTQVESITRQWEPWNPSHH